jgi:hypothetical protein
MTVEPTIRYDPETDTMAIEIRPWSGRPDEDGLGRDAGEDLVIDHASAHPEHIAAALAELRRHGAIAA